MGYSQMKVATELRVSQSIISRMRQRHRESVTVTEREVGVLWSHDKLLRHVSDDVR